MEDDDRSTKFYEQFSRNLKLGVHEDSQNRQKLAKLLRYHSSLNPSTLTSLDDYITNMPENQSEIYYITGQSLTAVQNSSFVEGVTKKGFNVLYMTEPIDEYVLQQLTEYDGKKLASITKEGFQLPETDDEKTKFQELKTEFEPTCKKIQEILKNNNCEKVFLSNRLTDSPCCVVTSQFGWSANMERIMKAQALNDTNSMSYMMSKKNLEINPQHPIIKNLKERLSEEDESSHKIATNLIHLIYETSLINSGFTLENPTNFSHRMFNMVKFGLGIGDTEEDTTPTPTPTSPMPIQSEDKECMEKCSLSKCKPETDNQCCIDSEMPKLEGEDEEEMEQVD